MSHIFGENETNRNPQTRLSFVVGIHTTTKDPIRFWENIEQTIFQSPPYYENPSFSSTMKIDQGMAQRTLLLVFLIGLRGSDARAWKDIQTYHPQNPQDVDNIQRLEFQPLDFSAMPSSIPSEAPTHFPTKMPSQSPTESPSTTPTFTPSPTTGTPAPTTRTPTERPTRNPTSAPTVDPYPPNDPPSLPARSYFNYDAGKDADYGPGNAAFVYTDTAGFTVEFQNNAWGNTIVPNDFYWSEFDNNGFGAWKGVLGNRNPSVNQCANVGKQSPIDVRPSGVECVEHHQVRTRPGDHGVSGASVDKRIESNKLRLVYQRRPCADILDSVCSEPDPPSADFPNGWGGFADMMHLDFKIPAEHRINGERFDAEMQIYQLHPGRRRVPAISSLIRVEPDGYNYYLQTAIDAFQYEYNLHRAQCADNMRRNRKLATDFHGEVMGDNLANLTMPDYETWGEYSRLLEDPGFIAEGKEHERRMQGGVWSPYHAMLIPTFWFYGYDGSLTEPPCNEFVSWFIMDTPMIISPSQLQQMKDILFTHIDPNCQSTSVHWKESVARPIQESAGRQVWQCTRDNFPPDAERTN